MRICILAFGSGWWLQPSATSDPPSEVIMVFKDMVKNRGAIRRYEDKKVPEETIREVLEITSYAVSAINLQPWKIRVVSDQETKDQLFTATFGQNQVRA